MNKLTTESFGDLPSYDIDELVLFIPEDGNGREIVCKVTGHQSNGKGELLYNLEGNLSTQEYLADFRCLEPWIEDDPADSSFEADFNAGILDELEEYNQLGGCDFDY